MFTIADRAAPPRAGAAQPLRLLHLPWQLTPRPGRPRPARGRRRGRGAAVASASPASGSPPSRRTTTPPAAARTVDARRRRGAAARPGRHPRARQRAGPHRVGGVRDRDRGRPRPAASPRSSTCRSTRSRRRPRSPRCATKRAVAEGQVARRRRLLGRGGARQPAPTSRRCTRPGVFGFKCFLLDSGVEEFPPPRARRRSPARWRETARIGALMIVHAEDGHLLDESALDGAHYAGFLASRPRAAEEAAIDLVIERARATGGRAHVVHLSGADAVPALRAARAAGVDVQRRDLPALPDLRRRAHRRRRHRAQVLPADPRGRQPRGAVGRARRGRHRLRRLRPLAVHRRTSRQRGGGDFGAGLGRHRLGPARAARGVDRRPRPRPRAGRRGALDGHRAGRPGRAGPQGPDRGRRRRRPGAVRARRGVHRRRRAGCTTATRSRRTPAAGWPAWSGRPGCAAYGRRPTDAARRGRLLQDEETR